jgi:hypothetical protein
MSKMTLGHNPKGWWALAPVWATWKASLGHLLTSHMRRIPNNIDGESKEQGLVAPLLGGVGGGPAANRSHGLPCHQAWVYESSVSPHRRYRQCLRLSGFMPKTLSRLSFFNRHFLGA